MINKFIAQQFASGKSLTRSYMNWHISQLNTLASPVLDIGAGEFGSASYHTFFADFQELEFYSVDIVPDKNPSKIADVQQHIPFDDSMFLTCLAFNLLEHLYDFRGFFREMERVLAPTGTAYLSIPFLFRVHADPNDYFRYTSSALQQSLAEHGFRQIVITPYGEGALTAALSQIDFLVPKMLRSWVLSVCVFLDRQISKRSHGKYRNAHDYPLGYFVRTQK